MLIVAHPSFDDRQQQLVAEILRTIAMELKKVEAPDELIKSLTGSIAFAITCLIDDSRSVDFDGGTLSPMLMFQVSEHKLAYGGGNTWMHEYVYRLLPGVLAQVDGGANEQDEP